MSNFEMNLSEDQEWRLLSLGSTVAAAIVVRSGIRFAYRLAKNEEPPLDPLRQDADWSDAVVFGVATGVTVGLARLLARTVASAAWENNHLLPRL